MVFNVLGILGLNFREVSPPKLSREKTVVAKQV